MNQTLRVTYPTSYLEFDVGFEPGDSWWDGLHLVESGQAKRLAVAARYVFPVR